MQAAGKTRVRWVFSVLIIAFYALVLVELGVLCCSPRVRAWVHARRLNTQARRVVMTADAGQQDVRRACSQAEKAIELTEGRSLAILDTAAWLYFRLGERERAKVLNDHILEIDSRLRSARELRQLIDAGEGMPWNKTP